MEGGDSIYFSPGGSDGDGTEIPGAEPSVRHGREMPLSEAVARLRRILAPGRESAPGERLGSFAVAGGPGETKAGDGKRRVTKLSQKQASSAGDDVVRAVLPRKLRKMRESNISDLAVSADSVQELERGLRYLEKFKRLSKAYREGEFSGKLGQKFAGGITLAARSQAGGGGVGDAFLLGQPEADLTIYADLDRQTSTSHDKALVPIYQSSSKGGDPRLEASAGVGGGGGGGGGKEGGARVYSKGLGERGSSTAQKAKIYRPRRGGNPRETW